MAPKVGLEPTTDRLTADCSTIELLWNSGPRNLQTDFLSVKFIFPLSSPPSPSASRRVPQRAITRENTTSLSSTEDPRPERQRVGRASLVQERSRILGVRVA